MAMARQQARVKHDRDENGAIVPLWVNVADTLRRRIHNGSDGSDGSDFSDVALSSEFKVSTVVVRQAVQQLVQEGLLIRRRGKGTFLANKPVQGGLDRLPRFVDEWGLQGHRVSIKLIDRRLVAANITVAAGLGIQPGETVCYLRRLRIADDLPVAMDYRYIPADLVADIPDEDFLHEAIWENLRRHKNVTAAESRVIIKAAGASAEVAQHLEVDVGAPVLDYEVQVVDTQGRVVILGTTFYHADRFVYSTKIKEPVGMGSLGG